MYAHQGIGHQNQREAKDRFKRCNDRTKTFPILFRLPNCSKTTDQSWRMRWAATSARR